MQFNKLSLDVRLIGLLKCLKVTETTYHHKRLRIWQCRVYNGGTAPQKPFLNWFLCFFLIFSECYLLSFLNIRRLPTRSLSGQDCYWSHIVTIPKATKCFQGAVVTTKPRRSRRGRGAAAITRKRVDGRVNDPI